jgi:hypothetical protein
MPAVATPFISTHAAYRLPNYPGLTLHTMLPRLIFAFSIAADAFIDISRDCLTTRRYCAPEYASNSFIERVLYLMTRIALHFAAYCEL